MPLQEGGGLYIRGTATLINSAIYQNEATVGARRSSQTLLQRPAELIVRPPFAGTVRSGSCALNQRRRSGAGVVVDSSALLERFVCSPSAQSGHGGGLYVNSGGVANLDGCNVFSNEAYVRLSSP